MNHTLIPSNITNRLKAWWPSNQESSNTESEWVENEPEPAPSPPIDLVSLAALKEQLTAVHGKLLQADNLDDVHTHIFNIFFDIDARRMVITDDPTLASLELPRRWPNMESHIAKQDATEFFCDKADVCVSHLQLPDKATLTNSLPILLAPISEIAQLAQLNGRSPQRLIVILYEE